MEFPIAAPTAEPVRQSTAPWTLTTSSEQWKPCAEKESPTYSYPVTPQHLCRGQQCHIVNSASTPDDDIDSEERCVAPSADRTTEEEKDADDTEDCNVLRNECGGPVLLPSRCDDTFALGVSLAVKAKLPVALNVSCVQQTAAAVALVKADADDSHAVSSAPAVPRICSPALRIPIQGTERTVQHVLKAAGDHNSFASKAMQAIALQATTGGPPLRLNCSRSDLSSLVGGTSGDDPMGLRQLYSLPGSRVGSSLGIPTHTQRGAAQSSAAADAFSMERFAAFYEVALEELMDECERRVANAPAAWRDSQQQLIGGDMNRDLATSTHSFDSPRSSAMSPFGGVPSSVALSCGTPVYSPRFTDPLHSTHGLHIRELSSDIAAVQNRTSTPLPPPSLHSNMAFFSAAGQARQAEQEKSVANEGAVSKLLAALGRHHGKMAPMVFIAGLAYLARVTAQCASEFLSVTRANWYRLTTTAILVAAKVYDEHSSSRLNACFARSSGIPLSEMTRMELDFLYLLDFDLLLKESEVEQWLIWMETLALRRDLMTPLNTYVLDTSASTPAVQLAGTPKPSFTSSTTLTEYGERCKTCAMCEASRTPGLSSEVPEGEEEAVGTSLSSVVVLRSVPQMHVASSCAMTAPCAVSSTANSRCPTGAAAATDAPSLTAPLVDLPSLPPRSSASSVLLPVSLLDGTFSAVSAASVPGGAPSSLNDRRTFVPPLPIHGALPLHPPTAKRRLFSVVHGTAEPPSPISVRQLGRLGGSPPSPLRPPSVGRHPSVRFFKSQATHAHGPHRYASGTVGCAELGMHGAEDGGGKVSRRSCQDQVTRAGSASAAGQTSAPAAASHQQKRRWGPLGMVQHVRDVLGVTASLVRGQLDVLAPSAHPEELSRLPPPQQNREQPTSQALRPSTKSLSGRGGCTSLQPQSSAMPPRRTNNGGTYPPFPENLMDERKPQTCNAPPAAAVASRRFTDSNPQPRPAAPDCHRCGLATPGAVTRRSPMPRSSPQHVDPCSSAGTQPYTSTVANAAADQPAAAAAANGAYADGDNSHDEDDEGYEECEYGYYDEDGYFHYYDDDEGAEGEYDEYYGEEDEETAWYEDEEEDEAAYFQRCRPPMTHSPPSL
ncbi:G1 cyclin CycE4 [Leishmania donovani]|nr:G1 cyclin CycE4 [Leishmania donovani]